MRTWKRVLAFVLALVMVLSLASMPTFAEGETETKSNYSIVINYVFANGEQAANPWTGSIGAGMNYSTTVTSPTVVGYTPDKATVDVTVTNASEDLTYTVTYQPALVSFKVEHWQQNVDNDQYTLVSTVNKTGYTESAVGEGLQTTYEGFYDLLYDETMAIAADGSTVVKIYYDRYYYLMSFDPDGGYGVDPVYARYGSTIPEQGDPQRAGYEFAGWKAVDGTTLPVPGTMPNGNTAYKATWTPKQVTYLVQYWRENANDNGYTYYESAQKTATAGTKVSGANDKTYEHFTFNADKTDKEVVVEGDGTTVVNVYYTRNTYTLTFTSDILKTFTCTKTEHTHSDSCCEYGGTSISHWWHSDSCCTLGLSEHTHGDSCYSYSDYTVTRKYDADITDIWENDPIKSLLDDDYVFKSSLTSKYYSFLEKMPGSNITMTKTEWSGNTYTWYYYLEVPTGMSAPAGATTKTEGGKTYYLYHTTTIKGNDVNLTYDEDYFPITGYTQRDKKGENGWNKDGSNYKHSFDSGRTYSLYYLRSTYQLDYISAGSTVKTESGIYYETPLATYGSYTPAYPAAYEEGAYTFGGWYTDQGCTQAVNWNTLTMPADNMAVYAKWVPVQYKVEVYKTSDMKAEDKIGETQVVDHRDTAVEPETPTHPASDLYEFVGWFYLDEDGTEKPFHFSKQITEDMKIYAKWSSNVMVDYTIKYVLEDGTEIAPATTGKNLAGTTKTFDAKTGTDLNVGYQSGYFPTTSSHNLELNIEGENTYSFVYIPKEKVPYTVKYLEVGTEKVLTEEKHAETRDAVITEQFEYIQGYAADAYQKRLVLSANEEENVIIFWYVADDQHAPVQIIHWIQNIEGDGYTEYQSSSIVNGAIGTTYSQDALEIPGFTYAKGTAGTAVSGDDVTSFTAPATPSAALTANGLVLNLYYDRIEYPYVFKFVDQQTGAEIADSVTGEARYQAQVTQTAKTITGYKLVSAESQAITIAIEDPANVAKINVKIFYYVPQYYVHHIQAGVDVQMDTYDVGGQVDLTTLVNLDKDGQQVTKDKGFLYGGTFDTAACDNTSIDYKALFNNTDGNPKQTQPQAGDHFYIWEPADTYLSARNFYVSRHVEGTGVLTVCRYYLFTNVDRLLYQDVGFTIDGEDDYPSGEYGHDEFNDVGDTLKDSSIPVYGKVKVIKGGNYTDTLYLNSTGAITMSKVAEDYIPNTSYGYMGAYRLNPTQFASFLENGTTFTPYWVTLDGVKVTGTTTRTGSFNDDNPGVPAKVDETTGSTCTFVNVAPEEPVLMSLRYVPEYLLDDSTPDSVTITINDNGTLSQLETLPGDVRGQLSYAAPEGKLFAGWFTDEACTAAQLTDVQEDITVYAKYVSDDYLTLKYNRNGIFRVTGVSLVSAIDSDSYAETGFIVNGETYVVDSYATRYRLFYTSGSLFGGDVARRAPLMTLDYALSGSGTLEVIPYWVTLDGTTVTGAARTLTYTSRTIRG